MSEAQIRIGIGGWTYPPWRGVFYPDKLPQAKELEYASQPARRDRDQRDLLRPAEAEKLGELGEDRRPTASSSRSRARAICVMPLEARRGRRGHRQFLRAGLRGARAQARADPVAVRAAPQSSTATTSRRSSTCFPRSSTGSRCATRSSRATKASTTSSSSSFAAPATSRSCSRIPTTIRCIEADTADFAYARLQRMSEEVADRL